MKKGLSLFAAVLLGCALTLKYLYYKPDIGMDIDRLRKEAAPGLDSLNSSLARQSEAEAHIRHLIAAGRDSDLATARQLIDAVLRGSPKNEYYLVLKGQVYDAGMQYDSALFEYDLAMTRDAFPYALDKRAKTFIKLRKYDQAIADYRNASDRNDEFSYPLARLFDQLHQKDSALKYYLIFTKDYPNPDIEKRMDSLRK